MDKSNPFASGLWYVISFNVIYLNYLLMLKDSSICKACTFISSEVVWGMWGLLLKEVLEILPQEHHRCIFPVAAADPGSELYVL